MNELKELLCLLEERLVQHNENRKEVQKRAEEIRAKACEEADSVEEETISEIRNAFNTTEEHILSIIEQLSSKEGDELDAAIEQAQHELSAKHNYGIKHVAAAESFSESYRLDISTDRSEHNEFGGGSDASNAKLLADKLREHLDRTHESVVAAQDKVCEICAARRCFADELESKINSKLERFFTQEDSRLQATVKLLKEKIEDKSPRAAVEEEEEELETKARTTLFTKQRYELKRTTEGHLLYDYGLAAVTDVLLGYVNFEEREPSNVAALLTDRGAVSLSFSFFSPGEEEVLKPLGFPLGICLVMWEKESCGETTRTYRNAYTFGTKHVIPVGAFTPSTTYCLKARMEGNGLFTKWSDVTELTIPEFSALCAWKECPAYVGKNMKYNVDAENPRIATKIEGIFDDCTIVGCASFPLNAVTLWSVKILGSKDNDGFCITIGVAPFDINQNEQSNYGKCGWYLDCFDSTLISGPPHNYEDKKYGPRKGEGQYVHEGDSIGVIMDTTKGELSFVLNSVSYDVAYERIPLDKPLVPCVILTNKDDSVELDPSGMKLDEIGSFIPVPSNISISNTTWDSITLTWDAISNASYYQIEVDGIKFCSSFTTNSFTKRGLFPNTEYCFRVCCVCGTNKGEWSDAVRGRTQRVPNFSVCTWKECPDDVDAFMKYTVDENNRMIALRTSDDQYDCNCTIIGNTSIPRNVVTSWSIKVLKSRGNDGNCIYIGVAPFDINQNEECNHNKCGWYIDCYSSTLSSGPPHYCKWKEYGPRKEKGEYVHEGDSVGIVIDTIKGELSFALDGVNLGVAYEGIPLDKPLVPCVIIDWKGDSVELDLSEVKENSVDSSIPIPSNITARSTTWDSITLTWDEVADVTFYQIEVDESNSWGASTINSFTKRGFFAETEHSFRVRVVRGSSVSEWSDIVKGRTLKAPEFPKCVWKECPDYVGEKKKYVVDDRNHRIATKNNGDDHYSTIIGNAPIPLNAVSKWSVKVLKLGGDDNGWIYVGIASSDINQNNRYNNYENCGWYFSCYYSTLWSGPPHNYKGKAYGSIKGENGHQMSEGDSVGVMMDTKSAALSFAVNGVDYDVAYEGIPLDKPLVPCVILWYEGNSVELIV